MNLIRSAWIGLAFAVSILAVQAHGAVMSFSTLADFDAATSGSAVVEDFETAAPVNTAVASLSSNGNTYTGLAGTPFANVYVSAAGFNNYGIPGATASRILTANGDEDFRVEFGTPTTAVGFDTYLNAATVAAGGATIQVFGAGGLLDIIMHTHDSTTIGFLGIAATEAITALRWTTVGGGVVNTGIDNIRTAQTAAVPEPSSLVLLFGSLLGLALARRISR